MDTREKTSGARPVDNSNISTGEQARRKVLAQNARQMISENLTVEDADETSLTANWNGFYLQISFSFLHPLMVICLARSLEKPDTAKRKQALGELNLRSVLGSHSVNDRVGCYSYRASQWLDTELSRQRFFEMLERCTEEAQRGYARLAS
jgi:hypothetical protein